MVKKLLTSVGLLSFLIFVGLYILGNMSKTGKPPGLLSGRLAPCPHTPNCVVSEPSQDETHHISPLGYPNALKEKPMNFLKQVIQDLDGEISISDTNYMAARFTTTFFGFVDDLECRHDKANRTIHLRSASRVGHSDFGANRKRVALISGLFFMRVHEVTPQQTLSHSTLPSPS